MGNTTSTFEENVLLKNENVRLRNENAKFKDKQREKDLDDFKQLMPQEFKEYFELTKNKLAVQKVHKVVQTGEEFKALFGKDKLFVKRMNVDMKHNGFQYQIGLNTDTVPFNPNGHCDGGGLYFTTIDHIYNWSGYNGPVRLVEIPDDAKVYCQLNDTKWKADKIIIGEVLTDKFIRLYNLLKATA